MTPETITIRHMKRPVPGHRTWLDIPSKEYRRASIRAMPTAPAFAFQAEPQGVSSPNGASIRIAGERS